MPTTSYRKKHLSAPLKSLLVLLLLMSCLLTSCGKGGTDAITADTDPEDIKGEEVTADLWKAAFDLSSLTNFSMKTSLTDPTDPDENGTITILFTEDVIQYIMESSDNTTYGELCIVREADGSYTSYSRYSLPSMSSMSDYEQEGTYSSRENLFERLLDVDDFWMGRMLVMLDELTFDMVTYDQKQKCYNLASSEDSDEIKSFHCKIVNGFVAYYKIESDWGGEAPIEETILYDIGTTTVEKPADLPQ